MAAVAATPSPATKAAAIILRDEANMMFSLQKL
jgi:hypothetical protein